MIVYRWRVYCNTDSKYCYVWSETEPTVCPENNAHSIDTSKTVAEQQTGEHPIADDGKPLVISNAFPAGTLLQFIGAGDDATLGRGMGQRCLIRGNEPTIKTDGVTSAASTREISSTDSFVDSEPDDLVFIPYGPDSDWEPFIIETKNSNGKVTVDRDWPNGGNSNVPFYTAKNYSREFQFNDWAALAGGQCMVRGAELGDYARMEVYGLASSVSISDGEDSGNCNLYDLVLNKLLVKWLGPTVYNTNDIVILSGVIYKSKTDGNQNNQPPNATHWAVYETGAYSLSPAQSNGTHNVDYDNAVPVPSQKKPTDPQSGYYTWSKPDNGKGTIEPTGPGSKYYLFAFPKSLSGHANHKNMLGDHCGNLLFPAIKPAMLLPHWKIKVTLHNCGHKNPKLEFCWIFALGRMDTT